METIERVARAIAVKCCYGGQQTGVSIDGRIITAEDYADIAWKLYLGHARAAMEAMLDAKTVQECLGIR